MKLPDKLYNTLKWIVMIAIPAMATAYVALAPLWTLPEPEKISVTANIVCALLGTLLGISTAEITKLWECRSLLPVRPRELRPLRTLFSPLRWKKQLFLIY